MERVLVFGSREFPSPGEEARARFWTLETIRHFPPDTVVISGGCRGVDSWADEGAKGHCWFVPFPADWGKHGKAAGPIRNSIMVEQCDRGVAIWDGASQGTLDTIRKLRAAGKDCTIVRLTPLGRPK